MRVGTVETLGEFRYQVFAARNRPKPAEFVPNTPSLVAEICTESQAATYLRLADKLGKHKHPQT